MFIEVYLQHFLLALFIVNNNATTFTKDNHKIHCSSFQYIKMFSLNNAFNNLISFDIETAFRFCYKIE